MQNDLYKTDTSLKTDTFSFPKGVRLKEVSLYKVKQGYKVTFQKDSYGEKAVKKR